MARPVRVFLALLLVASAASAEPLTTGEREKLLAHLETTRHALLASVDGLTDAQWNYRTAEGRWTIAEVAEHIAATEQMLRGMVEGAMKEPATAEMLKDARRDDFVLQLVPDRSQKFQAAEPLQPTNRYGSPAATVEDLGVVPDAIHRMTKKDVLSGNVDLINQAGEMLATMPVFAVEAKVQNAGAAMRVDATIKNVTRLDVFLNARPFRSLDVVDGATSIDLPQLGAGSNTLELRGFRNGQLVVSTRVDL